MNNLLVNVQTIAPDDSVKSGASTMLDQAKAVAIGDSMSYSLAATALANIKGRWKTVDEQRVELKAPSLEGCRRIDAFFAAPLKFLKDAETILKDKLDVFDKEQKRLAEVEQARLNAIAQREREKREAEAREAQRKADEKAAAERKAAEDKRRAEEAEREKVRQAELARLKAECDAAAAQARGDREARLKAEREAQAAREREAEAQKAASAAAAAAQKLEVRAASTEQRGAERAEMLQQQAASVVAPIVQVETPKVAGLSSREVFLHEVTDLMTLVKAVAEGKQPLAYLAANDTVLAGMAKQLKQQMNVPGVRVYSKTITASKAAR